MSQNLEQFELTNTQVEAHSFEENTDDSITAPEHAALAPSPITTHEQAIVL